MSVMGFISWRLTLADSPVSLSSICRGFVLLCLLHALLFAAALRLPPSIDKTTEISTVEEESMILGGE